MGGQRLHAASAGSGRRHQAVGASRLPLHRKHDLPLHLAPGHQPLGRVSAHTAFTENWRWLQFLIGSALARVLVAFLFIPAFYRYDCTTIYEFLLYRFGQASQVTGSLFFFITRLLGSGVRLMAACLAVALLVGWPLWATIALFTAAEATLRVESAPERESLIAISTDLSDFIDSAIAHVEALSAAEEIFRPVEISLCAVPRAFCVLRRD